MDIQKNYSCLEHNGKVMSKQIELEADYQESIPAYCDDIYRVVKCVGRSFITSADINYNEVKIYGKVEIFLTYFNENSSLCYVDFEEEFVKTVSVDGLSEAAFVCADIYDKYTNYRVINQRRIDIHNSSVINLNIYDRLKCPAVCSCENSKLKSKSVKLADVVNTTISKIEFDEEFSLPSGSESIKRIVSFSAFPSLNEIKIIKDKALIKADISVNVLYTADNEDESVESVSYNFAVSKIVDAVGINDTDIAISKLSCGSIFVKAKSSGGEAVNTIDIFGEITADTLFTREAEQELITDGYIIGNQSECVYGDYQVCEAGTLINENKLINLSFPLPDDVTAVLELSLVVGSTAVKKGKIISKVQMNAVCRTSSGELTGISGDDEIEIPLDSYSQGVAAININSYDYTLSPSQTIDVRLNAQINAYTYNMKNYKVLSDIEASDDTVDMPSLTIYFGKENEELWDIAKSFSSDMEKIMSENSLSGDVLNTDTVLIIPRA